jgi:hypothetical protein
LPLLYNAAKFNATGGEVQCRRAYFRFCFTTIPD